MSISLNRLNAVVDISLSNEIYFHETTEDTPVEKHLVQLQFFSEGGANVLFHISLSEEDVGNNLDVISGSLLRLRKTVDVARQNSRAPYASPPPFISAEETYKYIYGTIGLDKSFVLEHRLVGVSRSLIRQCNEYLAHVELLGVRDKRRVGERLGTELNSALLVKDMTSYERNCVTFELKPKWLTASPGVENALRCRTCAWHVKNNISHQSRYCPHALISKNSDEIRKQVKLHMPEITASSAITTNEAEEEITRYFCDPEQGFRVLDMIREQQEACDSHGVLSWARLSDKDNPESLENLSYLEDLAKAQKTQTGNIECAMTLRDCTLFIKLKKLRDGSFEVDAQIGDLDPKIASPLKLAKWVSDEYSLRAGGYYHGKEARNPGEPAGGGEICIHWRNIASD